MARRKVSDPEIKRTFNKTHSVTETAKKLGVAKSTISKRLKLLTGNTTKLIVLEHASQVLGKEIDIFEQITKINEHANSLLDMLMNRYNGDIEAIEELERDKYKLKDPRELAIRIMAEIRGQLKLQLDIYQSIFDMKAAAEFQQEVLQAIGETSPDVRDKIMQTLTQRRAIRSSVKFL